MSLQVIPNLISLLRFVMLVPYLHHLLKHDYKMALCWFFLAGLSDALDGFVARLFNCSSQFGAFLDPLADKLLLINSFIALYYLGHLEFWCFLAFVLRDLIIMLMVVLIYWWHHSKLMFQPIFLSKLNTTMQISMLLLLLHALAFPHGWVLWHPGLQWVVVGVSWASLGQYVMIWFKVIYGRW